MKKILLLIFIFIVTNVNAETFYTDYYLFSENNPEYIDEYFESDLYDIEIKEIYDNYKEIRTNENYYKLNKAPSYLKYHDLNDFIYAESYEKNSATNNTIYNTNRIKKIKLARFIVLRSFISNAILKNIKITYNEELIDYNLIQNNYNFKDKLPSNYNIVIDLKKQYDLSKINIEFNFEDSSLSRIAFMLDTYEYTYKLGIPHDYYDNELYRHNSIETYKIDFKEKNDFLNLIKNIYWIKSKDYEDTFGVTYYKDNIKLYKYYDIKRDYLNIYTETPLDGYKLDLDKVKYVYDYYKIEFIEVKDEIDSIDDINEIIITSSIPKEEINISYYLKKDSQDDVVVILNYKDSTFFKKLKIKNHVNLITNETSNNEFKIIDNYPEEIDNVAENKNIVKKKIKTTTKTITTTKNDQLKTEITTTKSEQLINNCSSNSFIYKKYLYILLIISTILFIILIIIMCKYFATIHK